MQQLSLFEPTPAPAKVVPFRPATPKPEPQEGIECIYPQPNYGIHIECNSPITHVGLDNCKCSMCGWIRTSKVVFSVDYPKDMASAKRLPVQPSAITEEKNVTSPEPAKEVRAWAESIEENYKAIKQLVEPISKKVITTPPSAGKILSFSITTERAAAMGVPDPLLAGIKICTRRANQTAPTIAYYERAYKEGLILQAYSAMPFVKEKNPRKLGEFRLTKAPYEERLKDMPEEDLIAEGGLWATKEDFINTVCKGKPNPELKVRVYWFELVSCSIE